MTQILTLRQRLDAKATELGFDSCRIVRPDAIPDAAERLARWLAEGHQGDMGWMAETAARRSDPRVLWPAVRSIVMLGTNYGPAVDPLETLSRRNKGAISVYARHRDYHDVIKGKLKHLATWLARASDEEVAVKVFVDTAPVMEKPLAAAAGVGWQGKHTNLVSRDFGSWLFLGSIFTTLDLAVDTAMADHCGSCRACLDICPTKAFPAPYRLDARRCISYLTIEHQGHIDRHFRPAIGNRIYGCDDCLAVCPWNKFAEVSREAKLTARADLAEPSLADLVDLDDAAFRVFFSGSPIKRIGHARFLRNVLIAIGNSGDPSLAPHAVARLRHPSPLVRAMAVWALHRLIGRAALRQQAGETVQQDPDIDVRAEWEAA
ncbi:tRNA epoxyqueuosine(34) reductase QueG [Lichenihabitans sp. PAMC28606]|uniref:tRNA epoxyqueuosine(34) reductase QueG n=1 Tax=Lichenihabitans sp. PAMC28606 TaxID=2880932 RepID=UPI001D0B1A5D|nr:tRNA epoxyqueuosine(34) reductase QueG [Lichenihabitans sp. PAMC28606]UDL93488.1 tRNA epoxyqueuosine(34) reductase QueG [Lichenihabitans sp. PAMC28606]